MNAALTGLRAAVLLPHVLLVAGLPLAFGWPGGLLALPLLAPLPGLWRARAYTAAWASMLVVVYTGGLLMEAFGGPGRREVALALAGASALEFCALLLMVRMRMRELRARAPD